MRAMIVAAGRGERMLPLTRLLPKPALPVRGLPLIAYHLALLSRCGVDEVMINLHHLPERLQQAAQRHCPPGMRLHFSPERELLDTGGAVAQVAAFLRESDPCLLLGGDMIVDIDLAALAERHRASGRAVTMLLVEHPRAADFGTLGLDRHGGLCRIAGRMNFAGRDNPEREAGIYTWVNVVSARAFDTLPELRAFNHLDDWWGPLARRKAGEVGGEVLSSQKCLWMPVGTLAEYLDANLASPQLSYLDVEAAAKAAGVRLADDLVLGAGAVLPEDARLSRMVVWDGERPPAGLNAQDGVFAGGAFHPCRVKATQATQAAQAAQTTQTKRETRTTQTAPAKQATQTTQAVPSARTARTTPLTRAEKP